MRLGVRLNRAWNMCINQLCQFMKAFANLIRIYEVDRGRSYKG
jgi:hypothetical protein